MGAWISCPSSFPSRPTQKTDIFLWELFRSRVKRRHQNYYSSDCAMQSASNVWYLVQCGLRMNSPIHGCRHTFNSSHICLVIVELLLKMWISIQSGFITVLLCRRMLPPAKEGGQGECTVSFWSLSQSLLYWPTSHKHLVFLLEDCSLISWKSL